MTKCVRFSALFLIIILAAACGDKSGQSPTAPLADTPENRKIAAKRYLEAMPPREMLQNMTAGITQRMPEEAQGRLQKAISDKELEENVYRISEAALIKHFTPDEMNAMTNFFGSPAGKSARVKYSPYMNEIMPQVNLELKKVFAKLQEQSPNAAEKEGIPKAPEQAKPESPKAAAPQPKSEKPEVKQPQTEQPKPEKPENK